MSSRMPMILGAAAVGGISYYMYRSGGNASAAKTMAKNDFNHASTSAEKDLKNIGAQAGAKLDAAGAKLDNAVAQSQAQLEAAKSTAQSYVTDAKHETLKKIDDFDRKVDESASKAKSWLGGK